MSDGIMHLFQRRQAGRRSIEHMHIVESITGMDEWPIRNMILNDAARIVLERFGTRNASSVTAYPHVAHIACARAFARQNLPYRRTIGWNRLRHCWCGLWTTSTSTVAETPVDGLPRQATRRTLPPRCLWDALTQPKQIQRDASRPTCMPLWIGIKGPRLPYRHPKP